MHKKKGQFRPSQKFREFNLITTLVIDRELRTCVRAYSKMFVPLKLEQPFKVTIMGADLFWLIKIQPKHNISCLPS